MFPINLIRFCRTSHLHRVKPRFHYFHPMTILVKAQYSHRRKPCANHKRERAAIFLRPIEFVNVGHVELSICIHFVVHQ